VYGGIGILAAGAVGLLYLRYLGWSRKCVRTELAAFLADGSSAAPGKKLLGLVLTVTHTASAGFTGALLAGMVKQSLIREESYTLILLLLLLTAAYAAAGTPASRARVYEILFWFVLAPLVLMLAVAVKGVDLTYFVPQQTVADAAVPQSAYLVLVCFGTLFDVFFYPAAERQAPERPVRRAFLTAIFALLAVYYLLLGTFGKNALLTLRYPVITLMSMIQFKGGFLKRLDAVMLGVWFFPLFALLNLNVHCAGGLLAGVFAGKKESGAAKRSVCRTAVLLLTFLAGLFIGYREDGWQLFADFFLYVQTPLYLILPGVFTILAGRGSTRKPSPRRKRALLGILAVVLAAGLGGCTSVELEQKQFPLLAAVRAEGDSYEILYEPAAEQKVLDYNHLKVMVFDEAFLEDAAAYEELLSTLQCEDTYPRNVYVCVTADAGRLMEQQDVMEEELGDYLEELLENHAPESVQSLPTIGGLMDEKENRRKTLYLPYLVTDGTAVEWDGFYCIAQSVPQGRVQETANLQQDALQEQIAKKILRFHVLANSDSEEDQAVKLTVRNAVGAMLEPKLENAADLWESRQIVEENLDGIIQTAEAALGAAGYDYGADAFLATVEFPEKTYGDFTFPAGEYEALEIVLGEGGGQNWWCVLYPNLCFRGSVYEVVDEDAKKELREVLTPEEYAEVFGSGRFVLRLKFLEYFRQKR
jgi:stage II sporulation protein R